MIIDNGHNGIVSPTAIGYQFVFAYFILYVFFFLCVSVNDSSLSSTFDVHIFDRVEGRPCGLYASLSLF